MILFASFWKMALSWYFRKIFKDFKRFHKHSLKVAGREGFEPPEVWPSTVFKTAAFDHSAISRKIKPLEATSGFEPEIKALQAHALPLGYVALNMVPEAGLEPARKKNSEGF